MTAGNIIMIMLWTLQHVLCIHQPDDMNMIIPITDTKDYEHLREELKAFGQLKTPTHFQPVKENTHDHPNEGLKAENKMKPNVEILLKLYSDLQKGKDARLTVGEADTVRTFSADVSHRLKSNKTSLTFDLRKMGSHEVVQKVELRIATALDDFVDLRNIKIRLSLRKKNGKKAKCLVRISPHDHISSNGHLIVDISRVIRRMWSTLGPSGRRNVLKVTFKAPNQRVTPTQESAVLVVFSQDKEFFKRFNKYIAGALRQHGKQGSSRSKRSSSHSCSLESFELDFAKLGWSQWIISPKYYKANLCRGSCHNPVSWDQNPTNHGVLLSYLRLLDNSIPALNCVPTKLSSMKMLYHEDDDMVMRDHKDMVAEECGCR